MRSSLPILIAFIFLLLQMTAANKLAIGEIAPDFPLLFVAYFGLHRNSLQGTIAGFIIGLLQDLFNPAYLGLNALLKSILGFVAGRIGSKTELDSVLFLALIIFLSHISHDVIYMFFYFGFGLGHILKLFFTVTIPSAIYTMLIGVLFHAAFSFLGLKAVKAFGKAK
jgi:rod shape-determining protein MreD